MELAKYRANVAAIILEPSYPLDCKIFVGERYDKRASWQFPQGGIDKGETPLEALRRELKEEIGTNEVDILAEYPAWINYEFPEDILPRFLPYIGQTQKYFLVQLQAGAQININTELPEFIRYKFMPSAMIIAQAVYFKQNSYATAIKYFKQNGYHI